MKKIPSTLGIMMAAGLTIGIIATVSAAESQVVTKTGLVHNQQNQMSSQASTIGAGDVTRVAVTPTASVITQVPPAAVPLTSFNPTTIRQPTQSIAAVALGPASSPTPVAESQPDPTQIAQVASPQPTQIASPSTRCGAGQRALAFDNPTISFRNQQYNFTPTPPITIPGGAAIAAIYTAPNGQVEICYSGDCINGPAGSCGAIGVAQPDGRVRVYVR